MDTSEQYIKMSWGAKKEIREEWEKFSAKQRLGTFICFRSFIGMIVNTEEKEVGGLASGLPETYAFRTWCDPKNEDLRIVEVDKDFDDEGFPLLRQDQIQEMMPPCNCLVCLTLHCGQFMHNYLEGLYHNNVDSMEQFWLTFYMHKKHGKIWDSKKWIARR